MGVDADDDLDQLCEQVRRPVRVLYLGPGHRRRHRPADEQAAAAPRGGHRRVDPAETEKEAEKVQTRLLDQVHERRSPRTEAGVNELLDRWLVVIDIERTTRDRLPREDREAHPADHRPDRLSPVSP